MLSMQKHFSEFGQANLAKQLALFGTLSKLAADGFERLLNLQMTAGTDALSEAQRQMQGIWETHQSISSDKSNKLAATKLPPPQPPVEKWMALGHEIAMISADLQNELLQAWHSSNHGKSEQVQITFDGTPFNLPYFSSFNALFTPNSSSDTNSSALTIKDISSAQPTESAKPVAQLQVSQTKLKKPAARVAKAKVSTAPSAVVTPATTSKPAKPKKVLAPKGTMPAKTIAATVVTNDKEKPSFPRVERRTPAKKAP